MSPLPISWSAPPASNMVLESILEVTLNAILAGLYVNLLASAMYCLL